MVFAAMSLRQDEPLQPYHRRSTQRHQPRRSHNQPSNPFNMRESTPTPEVSSRSSTESPVRPSSQRKRLNISDLYRITAEILLGRSDERRKHRHRRRAHRTSSHAATPQPRNGAHDDSYRIVLDDPSLLQLHQFFPPSYEHATTHASGAWDACDLPPQFEESVQEPPPEYSVGGSQRRRQRPNLQPRQRYHNTPREVDHISASALWWTSCGPGF
ncbi:hypothetical protein BJ742DRAFT_797792 [Cladochytrium replicatum]|nr:hypothetical protein BJ742DRAFT_797792 [Cladochytrium replicatum]